MGRFARQFTGYYKNISEDIFKFCDAMNFVPTWQQKELLTKVQLATIGRGSNWIACRSGQGPGKTTCSTIIGLWRSLRAVNALTIVTAPTMRQCRDVWLVEARRRVEKADPVLRQFIKVTKTKVEIGGLPDWGVKLVTATKEENAQGYHEENMSVICEEASGIPREIVTQFKGTLSNPNSLFLMIGNPNSRDCAFFDCFHSRKERWDCSVFNAEDTARDYPLIVSPKRNQDIEDEFGRDSDVYRVRVLGEFPFNDPNCVISSEELAKVTDRSLMLTAARTPRAEKHGGGLARQFGMDFARFGSDECTTFRRSGNAIVEWEHFAHQEPADVVDDAFRRQKLAGWSDDECWYVPDAGGMGQGVLHKFYDAGKQVHEFHNGGRAMDRDYANKITEAWFHVARLVKARTCYLPPDQQLIQQLSGRQYYVTKKGQLILETKEEYEKRGFNSPDRGDGCVLSMYDDVEATGNLTSRGTSNKSVGAQVNKR